MKKGEEHKGRNGLRLTGLFRTIFLTSILCMLIPLVVTVVSTMSSVYKRFESTESDNLIQFSDEKMNEVDFIITNQIALTKAVAESPYIAQAVADEYHAGSTDVNVLIQDYLNGIFTNADGLYENFFITCGTAGIADGLGGATLHDVTGEPWYDACVQEGSFLGNNISPVTGRPVFVVSYAIKDPDTGEVVGGGKQLD